MFSLQIENGLSNKPKRFINRMFSSILVVLFLIKLSFFVRKVSQIGQISTGEIDFFLSLDGALTGNPKASNSNLYAFTMSQFHN